MWGAKPESSSGGGDQLASADAFARAHRELLKDPAIQFDLPVVSQPEPPLIKLDPGTFGSGDPGAAPQIIFWVVLALAAAGLLYLIAVRLAGWRRRQRPLAEPESCWQPAPEPALQLLGDADALAAAGRYSEAAHLLLHRSIQEIDRRRPASVRKALTSRDIAGLPAIPHAPASAFARIVGAVERSLFGGRALDAADWSRCREAYELFAFSREWQA